jgi:hypothetical protein
MQYKTLLDYSIIDTLKDEFEVLHTGLWMLDLNPKASRALLGPYDSIASAHDNRDYLWNYGDRYGRYLWLVSPRTSHLILTHRLDIQHIEASLDTLPMEVVSMKIKITNRNEWIKIPQKRVLK